MLRFIFGVAGLILLLFSIISAIFFRYSSYYAIFIIGWFLFFDYLSLSKKSSVVDFFMNNGLKFFIVIFSIDILLGFLADYVYGREIASLWTYPSYNTTNYFLLYFIIYPVGALGMYSAYSFVSSFIVKKNSRYRVNSRYFLWVGMILFITPILNYFLMDNKHANYISPIAFFAGIFVFDYIATRFGGNSFIISLSNKRIFLAILATSILGAMLHEYPNLFAKEWQYANLPLTNASLFNIPLVVMAGWIVLTMISVSFFNMVKAIKIK